MKKTWPTDKKLAKRLELSLIKPAHAYLFSGVEGCGALLLAEVFSARLLNVEYFYDNKKLAHPNVVYIQPEEGKSKISIKQIHSLISHSAQTGSRSGLQRIFIIDRADQLSREAATALLKTLEEPNSDVVFILTTHSQHTLLPTIRSRVVTITLSKLKEVELQNFLIDVASINSDEAQSIAHLSGGRVELALQLTDNDTYTKYKNDIEQATQFLNGTISEKFIIAKQVSDCQESHQFLDRLSYTMLVESSILVTAINQERVVEAEKQLSSNVNPRFVLENLALQWRKI